MNISINDFSENKYKYLKKLRVGEILYLHYDTDENGDNYYMEIEIVGNDLYYFGNGYEKEFVSSSNILKYLEEFPYDSRYNTNCKYILKTVNPHPLMSILDEDGKFEYFLHETDLNPSYSEQKTKYNFKN